MYKKNREGYYRANRLCYLLMGGYWLLTSFEGYISGTVGALSRYYILVLIAYLAYSARYIEVTKIQIALAVWIIFYFTSLTWSMNREQGYMYLFSVVGMTAFLLLILGLHFEAHFIEWCIKVICFSSFLLGILGLFYSKPYGYAVSRQVLTLFGVQPDPNNLVALYASGAAIGLYKAFFEKGKWRLLYAGVFLVNAYDILMCGSRSGVVVLGALVCVTVLFRPLNEKHYVTWIRRIFIIFILLISLMVMIKYLPEEVWNRISGQDSNLAFTDSTGRTERWMTGIKLWWDTNPILGCGWGSYECHGTFFTFLVDTGVVGILLFWGSVCIIALKCIKQKNALAIMIMISGIIPALLIGAQNKRFFWNAIIIPVMMINQIGVKDEGDSLPVSDQIHIEKNI